MAVQLVMLGLCGRKDLRATLFVALRKKLVKSHHTWQNLWVKRRTAYLIVKACAIQNIKTALKNNVLGKPPFVYAVHSAGISLFSLNHSVSLSLRLLFEKVKLTIPFVQANIIFPFIDFTDHDVSSSVVVSTTLGI